MDKKPRTWSFLALFCASLLVLVLPRPGLTADQLDPASTEALQKIMNLLQSDTGRQDAVQKSPDAQAVDAQVKSLGGNPQNTDAIYQLSSEVFSKILEQTGGDVTKMQAIMRQAQENPKAFYDKYFSTQDKAKVEQIAGKISQSPSTAPSNSAGARNQ
jgi:predicted secreted protein